MKEFRAGIDVGSTTVKLVVLDENNNLPAMDPIVMEGTLTLEPATIAYVVM